MRSRSKTPSHSSTSAGGNGRVYSADYQTTPRRQGTHNWAGIVTLGGMVESYTRHLETHLVFLRAKRQRLGKPLAE